MGIRLMGVVFGLVAVSALFGNPAVAARMIPPLSFKDLNQFKLNPQSLNLSPGTAGPAVEASTRDLAATEPQLAPDLVHVAQTAQPRFQGAIAASLAQAALTCLGVDQQAALQVPLAVAGFEDSQFQVLFMAVVGDLSTAATSAASAAAAGSARGTNPHRSVRSTSGTGGGGASSTSTASVFGVAALNQSARTGCGSSSEFDALT